MERVFCFGGAHLDRTARCRSEFRPTASNPVTIESSPGGAALNTAFNLERLGGRVSLLSALGCDPAGEAVLRAISGQGLDTAGLMRCEGRSSASYTAILNPQGDLVAGLADMDIYDWVTADALEQGLARLAGEPSAGDFAFLDANLPEATLAELGPRLSARGLRLAAAAVSPAKVSRLAGLLEHLELLFCSRAELAALIGRDAFDEEGLRSGAADLSDSYDLCLLVTRGAEGGWAFGPAGAGEWTALATRSVDVNGAGDAFAAGTLHGLRLNMDLRTAVLIGRAAASLIVEVSGSTDPDLSFERVRARMEVS